MSDKPFKTTRNAVIKSKFHSPEIASWYEDLQSDYRKFFRLFFDWACIPYGVETVENGTERVISYVTEDQARADRKVKINDPVLEGKIDVFIDRFLKGGAESSSCYGIFSEAYKPSGKSKKDPKNIDFLNEIANWSDEELAARLKKKPRFLQVEFERWRDLGSRIAAGESADDIWKEIETDLANDNSIIPEIRQAMSIECKRPHNKGYCSTLAEMIARSLRSCYEKNKFHQTEFEELRAKLEEQKAKTQYFDLIKAFADRLESVGSGLSRDVLKRGVEYINNNSTYSSNIAVQIEVLRSEEFAPLLSAPRHELNAAYYAWKTFRQIARRRTYPFRPKLETDYKVPVGQTGLGGGFTLDVVEERGVSRIIVGLKGIGTIACLPSHYMHAVQLVQTKSGYAVKFRHKLKSKNMPEKLSPEIAGEIKEIGISSKNGALFVSLPHTITHSGAVRKIQNFFRKASPTQADIDALPDTMKVAGFDLNINNPVCGIRAEISKSGLGPLTALDYGRGVLQGVPEIIADNGPRYRRIQNLAVECRRIVRIIREYKACQRQGKPLSDESIAYLSQISSPADVPRVQIQSWVKRLGRLLKGYKRQVRNDGYRHLGESIQLLSAMDNYQSLRSSLERIHLLPGQQLPKVAEFDESRANYRKHLSRRIAATIVAFASGCDAIFIEDLNSQFDSDKENNSLGRLFSANTLKEFIKMAAEKVGIAVIEVAKEGTSKTDPVTGKLCGRNTRNGDKLRAIVERDGVLGWIHSDLAASVNVLIRGLGHSVCPYKVWVDDKGETRMGERSKRFFKDRYQTQKPVMIANSSGIVEVLRKKPKDATPLRKTYVYFYGETPCTEEYHRREESRLKDLGVANKELTQFDVTLYNGTPYRNFAIT